MDNSSEMRIGNPERSRAIDLLSERFADGYLDMNEFEDRTGKASQATFKSELDALFTDLPASTPSGSASGANSGAESTHQISPIDAERELQEVRRKGKLVYAIDFVLWTGAIIIMLIGIFTQFTDNWWIVFPVAGIGSWASRAIIGLDDTDEEIYEKLEKQHKDERKKRIEQAIERKRELGQ
ncbi:DUF1707 SHOCT-like domain-containing protein [Corynebacterium suicordis]